MDVFCSAEDYTLLLTQCNVHFGHVLMHDVDKIAQKWRELCNFAFFGMKMQVLLQNFFLLLHKTVFD